MLLHFLLGYGQNNKVSVAMASPKCIVFLKSIVDCSGENANKSASTSRKIQESFHLVLCRCIIISLIAGSQVLPGGEVHGGQWNVVTAVRLGDAVHSHTLSLPCVISQLVCALARTRSCALKGKKVTNPKRQSTAHLPLQKLI